MQIPQFTPITYNDYAAYPYSAAANADDNNFGEKLQGCQTCDNRTYQDKSSDGSVSMQSPTKLNPSEAAHMVAAHEQEHIRNDRIDAEMRGDSVVYQSVRLHYDICRECGISYVSGGEATTVSKSDNASKFEPSFNNGAENLVGDLMDLRA
jgi:hypothetical protein